MKFARKQLCHLLLSVCLCTFLPGCWDYVAINTRAPVIGMGFDPASDDSEKLQITAQIPVLSKDVGQQSSGSGSSGGSSNFQNVSVEASSIAEALSSLQLKINRQIDIAQLRIVVFNEKLSSTQMDSTVGQLIRVPKINRLAHVVTTPNSAQEILNAGADISPTDYLEQAFRVRQQGYVVKRELWQYWRDVTQVGAVPVIPTVRTGPQQDGKGNPLMLGGVEVYLSNQPSFEMNEQETFDMNLLIGHVRDMGFDVPLPNGTVSFTDVRAKSHLGCIGNGENIVLVGRVSVSTTLARIASGTPKPMPATNVNVLESETSEYLKGQITQTLRMLQQHQSDVAGFGRIYLQRHPEEEAKVKAQWGEMFSNAKLDIKVQVHVSSKGDLI